MDRRLKTSTSGALLLALACGAFVAGPVGADETKPVYVTGTTAAVDVNQILASGDSVDGSSPWQGIPDGMGGVKNDDGSVSVFVNHELSASDAFTAKTERPYGGWGATISKVTVNADGSEVTKIESAIDSVSWYDYESGTYGDTPGGPVDAPAADSYGTPNHSVALNRFCSATLVASGDLATRTGDYVSKVVKVKKKVNVRYIIEINGKIKVVVGKRIKKVNQTVYLNTAGHWTTAKVKRTMQFGTQDPIFLTGEEGADESRIFALETKTGELKQLPALGLGATENINIARGTGKTTVAMMGEDGAATDSQLFMYQGTKTRSGDWAARAGLTNGKHYVASVSDFLNTAGVITTNAVANDINARSAMMPTTISSVVRTNRAITSASIAIVDGVATVTAANNFVTGESVSISGLTDAQKVGIDDLTDVQITKATSTYYTFQTDGVDEGTVASPIANTVIIATPSDNRALITTLTANNLAEGDTVAITGVDGVTGKYEVTGTPSTTKFTIDTDETTMLNISSFGAVTPKATRVLNVEFKAISTDIAGDAQQTAAKLRGTEFARIEDAAFNPTNPNEFYFVTTQTDSDGTGLGAANSGGGVWKLTYADVTNPTLGATLELVLDGSETPSATTGDPTPARIVKLDNITFSADGTVVFLQEDPGALDHVSRVLALQLSTKKLIAVAKFDNDMFGVAGDASNVNSFMTNDEETSGIFDASNLFGGSGSTLMFNAQVHPVSGAAGVSFATDGSNDGLIARATAILRPDLLGTPSNITIMDDVANQIANVSTKTYLTLKLSGVSANAANDGFIATGDATDNTLLSATDTVTLRGIEAKYVGTYSVVSIDTALNTIKVAVKQDAAYPVGRLTIPSGAVSRVIVSDDTTSRTFKKDVVEGGALYTLKIADLVALFN